MSWKDKTRTDVPTGDRANYPLLERGMYLLLLHGFPDEDAREAAVEEGEWGADGPLIGPLWLHHTTYAHTMHFHFSERANLALYRDLFPADAFMDGELFLGRLGGEDHNMICCGGIQYGDWETFYINDAGELEK